MIGFIMSVIALSTSITYRGGANITQIQPRFDNELIQYDDYYYQPITDEYDNGQYHCYLNLYFPYGQTGVDDYDSIENVQRVVYEFEYNDNQGSISTTWLNIYPELVDMDNDDRVDFAGLYFEMRGAVSNLYIPSFKVDIYTFYDSNRNDIEDVYINGINQSYHDVPYQEFNLHDDFFDCGDVEQVRIDFDVYAYNNDMVSYVNNGQDFNAAYQDGYNAGKEDGASTGYTNGYREGSSEGYNSGFEAGEQKGYLEGLGAQNPYTFTRFFGAIADVPILYVRQLLGFDVFGIPALTILMSMITACLVLYLLRRVIF